MLSRSGATCNCVKMINNCINAVIKLSGLQLCIKSKQLQDVPNPCKFSVNCVNLLDVANNSGRAYNGYNEKYDQKHPPTVWGSSERLAVGSGSSFGIVTNTPRSRNTNNYGAGLRHRSGFFDN